MRPARLSVWAPLPPGVWLRSRLGQLPYPLEEPGCRLFAFARQGLWHGVQAVGLGGGDEVLVPAYHHGSEIEALLQAGLHCRYYDGLDGLEPDEEELEGLLGPKVRALLLIHYLGFPQDAPRWRRWCDERGLLLIEDAAQSWLTSWDGRPSGSLGHVAVFCLYKTVGVPEGAAVVARAPLPAPAPNRAVGVEDLVRRHGAWLAQRSAPLSAVAERVRRGTPYLPERDMALGDPRAGPWRSVPFLVRRLADPRAASTRLAHYRLLSEQLGDRVPARLAGREQGASPFVYPLLTDDAEHKAALLERLERAGIRAANLWSVPHPSLPAEGFPGAARLRARLVGLPVHQELRLAHLRRITGTVGSAGAPAPTVRLQPVPDLSAVEEQWIKLAQDAGNIFATWEWVSSWRRHLGGDRPLLVSAGWRQDGTLAVLLPLYLAAQRPLRVVRFLGHGPGDELGPICREGDEVMAARALREALDAIPGWDLFVGEQLPGDEGWATLTGARVLRRDGSPVLRFESGGWEEFLSSRSANFRQQVRRRERNLARHHDVVYRLADDPARLDDDLAVLFRLHAARWGCAHAFSGRERAFHQDFARLALERGWLRLWLMELDGHPAAAWYGFRFAGAEWYYQSGRDPRWSSLSVGFVLMAHSIREAMGDGMTSYRLLRGGEAYKERFASEDPGLETIGMARGPAGRGALAAAVAARALPPAWRDWMRRGVGS